MKRSVIQTLILTDLRRHRLPILACIASGIFALGLIRIGGELPVILGTIWFFTGLIVLGCLLPGTNVINERKKQTLPFLMSLPVSITQFTTAKIVSTVGMFIVPWLTLVIAAVLFILGHPRLPDGMIPVVLAIATLTLVGFCLIAGVALVSEAEGPMAAAMVVANSSYGLGWYLLVRMPGVRAGLASPEIIWGKEILTVLGFEFAVIVLILGLTIYLQSRKRDFV